MYGIADWKFVTASYFICKGKTRKNSYPEKIAFHFKNSIWKLLWFSYFALIFFSSKILFCLNPFPWVEKKNNMYNRSSTIEWAHKCIYGKIKLNLMMQRKCINEPNMWCGNGNIKKKKERAIYKISVSLYAALKLFAKNT